MTRILILLAAILIVLAAILMFRGRTKDSGLRHETINKPNEVQASNDLDFSSWNDFTSDQGDFRISMPGIPQHVADMIIDQKTLEPHKYETFASVANNGVGYVVNVITLPSTSKPEETSLKGVVTDMLNRNKENQLKGMKTGSFHEKKAVDFSFENKDVSIDGKVFAHGNKIFVLSTISQKDSSDKKNFDFFVNSFHLLDEQPTGEEEQPKKGKVPNGKEQPKGQEQPKTNEKKQNSDSYV